MAIMLLGICATANTAETPWSLRNHITFSVGACCLDYAEDDAEWRVRLGEGALILDKVGFSVTFEDGRSLSGKQLGKASPERTGFTSDLGDGTFYTQRFAPKDGLRVAHRIAAFKAYPFAVLTLELENTGSQPIMIESMSPVVLGPASMPNWGSDATVLTRHVGSEGGYPTFGGEQPCVMSVFHDAARNICIGIGLLPRGDMTDGVTFEKGGSGWHGAVTCRLDPAISLAPGRRIESDPVWISYGTPEPDKVNDYYSYALSRMPRSVLQYLPPMLWFTAPEDAGLAELESLAKEWHKAGVTYALVPAGWEHAPGSMQGANPRYPSDMGAVAAAIRKAGMFPGITVDPMLGNGEGAWLNPEQDEAAAALAGRMKRFQEWGFRFIVATPSAVPDARLKEFGLTRNTANRLALGRLIDAAGDMRVLPSATAAIPAERDAWLEAAAFSSRLAEFAISPAPVRMDTTGLDAMSEELAAAMRLWPGAIEVMGLPTSRGLDQFARFAARDRVSARCVDGGRKSPLLWQANIRSEQGVYIGGAVIAFSGASGWQLADLRFDQPDPIRVWHPADGNVVDTSGEIVPAGGLSVIGLSPHHDRPHLLGASTGLALHLDRVKSLDWDEAKRTLRGSIEGPSEAKGAVYVAVPAPWKLTGGKVNNKKLNKKLIGNLKGECLMIAMGDDGMQLELVFAK